MSKAHLCVQNGKTLGVWMRERNGWSHLWWWLRLQGISSEVWWRWARCPGSRRALSERDGPGMTPPVVYTHGKSPSFFVAAHSGVSVSSDRVEAWDGGVGSLVSAHVATFPWNPVLPVLPRFVHLISQGTYISLNNCKDAGFKLATFFLGLTPALQPHYLFLSSSSTVGLSPAKRVGGLRAISWSQF